MDLRSRLEGTNLLLGTTKIINPLNISYNFLTELRIFTSIFFLPNEREDLLFMILIVLVAKWCFDVAACGLLFFLGMPWNDTVTKVHWELERELKETNCSIMGNILPSCGWCVCVCVCRINLSFHQFTGILTNTVLLARRELLSFWAYTYYA